MLTVLLAIRIARPFRVRASRLVFACGSCDSHRRPATLSCHRTSLYIRRSFACRRCFPGDFRPRAARPGFFRARFVFSALPVAATPCGSRYSLSTTQVRGTYAAEAVFTGCRSPPPRDGGSTFSLLPQQPCRPLCLAALSVSPVSPARHRSRFFASPMPLPTLGRCRYQDLRSAFAATRLRQAGYATFVPFTLADEGVSVTQCCNLFLSLNAALSNNAHS